MLGDAEAKCPELQKNDGLEKNFDLVLNDSYFLSCFGGCAVGLSCEDGTPKIACGAWRFYYTRNPSNLGKPCKESQKLMMNW